MTDTQPDPLDAARARMHEQAAESRQRNDAIRTLADAVETATAVARSRDGSVTVTAATSGAVKSIDITDGGLERGASALSGELVTVIAAAQRAALQKAAELSAQELGGDHPLVADLRQSASRFGDVENTPGYR